MIAIWRVITFALVALSFLASDPASSDRPSDPRQLLTSAFDRMFNYPSVRRIELRILRDGRTAGRRVFDVAYQKVDGLGHTILRFIAPEYLRGNALLMIETEGGLNQTWLYQPEEGRPRRVSTYQKGDAFYGTDLAFEDLESRRWQNYDVEYEKSELVEGQSFFVVDAAPRVASPYGRVSVWIEAERMAIGRIAFYHRGDIRPTKTLTVDLDTIALEGGLIKPRLMRFERVGRDWATEVRFLRIEVSPTIAKRAFTTMRLLAEGEDLFHMVERLRGSATPGE